MKIGNNNKNKKIEDDLRPEYHFDYSKSIQGKYVKQLITKSKQSKSVKTRLNINKI